MEYLSIDSLTVTISLGNLMRSPMNITQMAICGSRIIESCQANPANISPTMALNSVAAFDLLYKDLTS